MCVCYRGRIARREEVVERVEGIEDRHGGCGREDPLWSSVFEVVKNDMNADVWAVPAKAMEEVCWHRE